MNVTTYAPPANATPVTTSKPIQIPQGKSWERFVVDARPLVNRITRRTAVVASTTAANTLNGVTSLPFGFISLRRKLTNRLASVIRRVRLFLLSVWCSMVFLVTFFLGCIAEGKQERRPQSEDYWHGVEIIFAQLRIRYRFQVGAKSELSKGNAGKIHVACPSGFTLAVDVVHVL